MGAKYRSSQEPNMEKVMSFKGGGEMGIARL